VTFRQYVIVSELWRSEARKRVEKIVDFLPFLKKRPLTGNVSTFCSSGITATPIDMFCANSVKFGQREVAKQARCLTELPKKFSLHSPALATARITLKIYQGQP